MPRGRVGAERARAVAERTPAVAIPRASYDICDVLHILRVTYVNIKVTGGICKPSPVITYK